VYENRGGHTNTIRTYYTNGAPANVITVGAVGCNFKSLTKALHHVRTYGNPSESNRYCINVYGDIEDTTGYYDSSPGTIFVPSYTTVIGHDATIYLTDGRYLIPQVTDVKFSNISIIRSGSEPAETADAVVVDLDGTTNATFNNVYIQNNSIGNGTRQHGIRAKKCTNLHLENCTFVGGGRDFCAPSNSPNTEEPFGPTNGCAAYIAFGCTGTIRNCNFIPGSGQNSYGIYLREVYDGIAIEGCTFEQRELRESIVYAGDGSQCTSTAVAVPTFISTGITVFVSKSGQQGSTIDIGTTPGNNDIGTTHTGGVGYRRISISAPIEIASDARIYFTPTDQSVKFHATVCRGIDIPLAIPAITVDPNTEFTNCNFHAGKSTPAVRIGSPGAPIFNACHFHSKGNYDISRETPGIVKAYNCTFGSGRFLNVTGFPGQGSATVAAGATYVDVTHSLPNTPRIVRATPTSNLGTRAFWVSDKGASTFRINISESDSADHTFDWMAEV
jgi:hypothetical protein